ncbi:MAG: PRC-barrel domain-containing protein [Patescibacteria group bacterium]|jgi:sporulation protein YlmC with PRC-barrel domain
MILRYTKLIGLPIFDLRDQSRLGKVADILVDPSGQKIIGFILLNSIFSFGAPRVVLAVDVIEVLKEAVIVKDEDAVIQLEEAQTAKDLFKKRYYGLNQKAFFESGAYIGKVYDYLIDSKTLALSKFYIQSLLKETVIPSKDVIDFDGRKIIVKGKSPILAIEQAAESISAEAI